MTEYWKQSPNYWCKHCGTFVRDTKLERQNHEATGRHQHAISRSLRELHRAHERGEREKERARREIDRLNGVVANSSLGHQGSTRGPRTTTTTAASTESSLKKQREQLAELGVSIPSDFRPDMAIPGEWTVTSSRVIGDRDTQKEKVATGVRKRKDGDDEMEREEQDAAVKDLFKKPRRWGRDSKALPEEADQELDALLSGTVTLNRSETDSAADEDDGKKRVKAEQDVGAEAGQAGDLVKTETAEAKVKVEEEASDRGAAPVVFKKRKTKGLRVK